MSPTAPAPAITEGSATTSTATQTFGQKLADKRTAAGLTKAQLAERLNKSASTISRLESGELRAGHALARLIEKTLGGSDDDLLQAWERTAPPGKTRAAYASRRPHLLPAPPQHLVGVDETLADITQAADTGAPVIITGGPGTGKTALALRWAHQQHDAWPDGTLLLNGRGRRMQPARSSADLLKQALHRLLRRGTPLADDLDGLAGQLHEALRYRRLLLLIDDAYSAEQVRPLLGIPGVTTVITSRDQLTGLTIGIEHALPVPTPTLAAGDATRLLVGIVGNRAASHLTEIGRIIAALDGVPLAIHAAGAHILLNRTQDISQLADELTGPNRLQLLHLAAGNRENTSLANCYRASLRMLSPTARRVLAAATENTAEFGLDDAARRTNLTPATVRAALTETATEHLTTTNPTNGTYRVPGLLANYLHTTEFDQH